MVIRRIGPMSCARISGTLYAVTGLILGAIFSLMAMAGGFGAESSEEAGFAAVFGVTAIIILPLLYGGIGFIATFIAAWLYNILAEVVGGIELDLQ
jgi:hypothetical protein